MEVINLNLIPSGALPVVHASQYDEGRTFRANLMDGSTVYTLDGTEVLECDVKKPDGNIVTVAVTNTSDSYVEIDTTLQMCACAGESLAELHIKKGAQEIGTLNFILAVERSPLENGIQSDSGIHNLQTQIGDAVADQYDAADVVFDATPTAGHGVGFAVTSEGVKNAIPDELDDLSDVTYTGTPAMGEAVVWDGSKWTNGTVSTVGSIDDLNDVDTTGKAEGDSLRFDSGSGDWVAKPIVIEVTQAEYNQLVLDGDLQPLTTYVITDAPNLNATAQNLSYDGGVTSTHDVIEGKADSSDIPTWIKQATGTSSGTIAGASVFGYYYADQWQAYIYLPFVAKNTNYTVNITAVSADNVGDVTSKCSVVAKQNGYFTVRTTKTMANLPDYYSVCPMRITYSIDFA